MARNQSFLLIGITISAPLGSILATLIPLQYVCASMFIPFIIATLIAISFEEPNDNLKRETKKYLTILKSGINELKHNKILKILTFDLLIIQILTFYILWMYQVYLEYIEIPIIFFGFIGAGMTISQIILSNIVAKCEKRFKNKRLFILIYSIIPGISFILLAFIPFKLINIILILIIVGFGQTRNIIFVKAINKKIESENRTTVLSTINMIGCLIKAIMYLFIGLLVTWNLFYTFIILGILIIIVSLNSKVKKEHL